MGGPEIDRLVSLLAKLPGLGPRSARRASLKLLQNPETRMLPLAQALVEAAKAVKHCHICGNLDAQDPCAICADQNRDRSLICVVEGVGDLWAIERAGAHRGLYHVLGGVLSPLGGIGPEDLNLAPLLTRLEDGTVREVILALGATVDGAATVHWLSDRLAAAGVAVSRVAHGVPMGGALEVLDDGTLSTALRARRPA